PQQETARKRGASIKKIRTSSPKQLRTGRLKVRIAKSKQIHPFGRLSRCTSVFRYLFTVVGVDSLKMCGVTGVVAASDCESVSAPRAQRHWQPGATPQDGIYGNGPALKARFIATRCRITYPESRFQR